MLPARTGAYSVDAVGNVHLVTLQPPADTLVTCTARPPQSVVFTPDRRWVIFAAEDPKANSNGATLSEVVGPAIGQKSSVSPAPDLTRDLWVSSDGRTLFTRNAGQSDPDKAAAIA